VEKQQHAWWPPNFEMIGLAWRLDMKMQTKRHLLSSRCLSRIPSLLPRVHLPFRIFLLERREKIFATVFSFIGRRKKNKKTKRQSSFFNEKIGQKNYKENTSHSSYTTLVQRLNN